MAVLVEAISVVVRLDRIARFYPGGWRSFREDISNATFCADDELARVGFLNPKDVERFVDVLSGRGLAYLDNGKCLDLAVVDQQRGPMMPCEWLEFGRLPFGDEGGRVSACWLFEGPRIANGLHVSGNRLKLATPPGWVFEGSLSEKFSFVPDEQLGV